MKPQNEKRFVRPEDDPNTQYHLDPIICFGCKNEFMLTVRDDPFSYHMKYCANCFGHLFSITDYQKVIRDLNPLQRILWETPVNELPQSIYQQVK